MNVAATLPLSGKTPGRLWLSTQHLSEMDDREETSFILRPQRLPGRWGEGGGLVSFWKRSGTF